MIQKLPTGHGKRTQNAEKTGNNTCGEEKMDLLYKDITPITNALYELIPAKMVSFIKFTLISGMIPKASKK